jgi:hypothetical protein
MKAAMEGFRDRFQPTETGPSDADKKAEEAKKSGDDKKSENGTGKDETVEMDTKAEAK